MKSTEHSALVRRNATEKFLADFRLLGLLLLFLCLPSFAADEQPKPAGGDFDFKSDATKQLFSKAADTGKAGYDALIAGNLNKLSEVKNQTLTWVILGFKAPDLEKDLVFLEGVSTSPDEFVEVMKTDEGCSFLKPKNIKRITGTSDEKTASGTIEVEVPGLYKCKVDFNATKVDGKWRVVKFTLPQGGKGTRLTDEGLWKITEAKK